MGGGQYVTYTEDTNKVFYNPQQEVPFAYKQLKCIENTSNAYIDTGYIGNKDSEYEINFECLQNLDGGLYESSTSNTILKDKSFIIEYTNIRHYDNLHGNYPEYLNYEDAELIPYKLKSDLNPNFNILIYSIHVPYYFNINYIGLHSSRTMNFQDNSECNTIQKPNYSFDICESLYIDNIPTTILKSKDSYLKTKLYEVTIKESDKVKVHLLPVKRISDGKVGMYDTINNKFLTSPNGTEFIGIE